MEPDDIIYTEEHNDPDEDTPLLCDQPTVDEDDECPMIANW